MYSVSMYLFPQMLTKHTEGELSGMNRAICLMMAASSRVVIDCGEILKGKAVKTILPSTHPYISYIANMAKKI